MKSIMKLAERDAGHAALTRSAVNPSTLFFSLWEWEKKWSWWSCCFAAQGNASTKNEWNEWFVDVFPAEERREPIKQAERIEVKFGGAGERGWFAFLFLAAGGGYGRWAPWAPPKRESGKKQTNQTIWEWNEFIWLKERMEWSQLVWWNEILPQQSIK